MESQSAPDQFEEQQDEAPGVSPMEIAGFVWRAARRHRTMGILIGSGILTVGIIAAKSMPQKYQSEARILVEESAAQTAYLSSNDRWRPNVDSLGESSELLRRKGSLASIVEDAELPSNWDSSRPLPLRIKDKVMAALFGDHASAADRIDALVRMLDARILIIHDKNIVYVRAVWQEPGTACRLAKLLENRLFESLQTQEFSAINAAITLLEEQAKRAAEQIPPALDAVSRIRDQANRPKTASSAGPGSNRPAATLPAIGPAAIKAVPAASVEANHPAAPSTPEAALTETAKNSPTQDESDGSGASETRGPDQRLTAKLSQIREQIKSIEGPWQRRIAELKLQLSEMLVTYAPAHPLVTQQEARIKAASVTPPELQDLLAQEQQLLTDIEESGNGTASSARHPRAAGRAYVASRSNGGERTVTSGEEAANPELIAAMAALHSAIGKYSELAKRVDAARFELTTAEVEFRRHYVVVSEPEVPKAPLKPVRALIAVGSLLASILLGIVSGALRELASGRIREQWQIRMLGLPILGEVHLLKRPENQ